MRRADRQQDLEFSRALMDGCTHAVVALSTGTDTPYCLPLSLVRVGDSLYFHTAKEGRKIDLLRQNPRVCVTFVGGDIPAYVDAGYYTTYFQSVIAEGTAVEVTEDAEKVDALRALCQKLTPDGMTGDHFDKAVEKSLSVTGIWRIDLDNISGKAKFQK
jgi:nitroimidazol reductase NimA-like FMN-containing flavoprotein (pyridoxamine 5'-phosphate oxidase superfamily)